MANKYPKISRLDNYYRLEIDKDKDVFYVEEKLDGSNVTISIYDEKTIRLFSRTTEIDQNEPGNWNGLVQWVNDNKERILEFIGSHYDFDVFPINFHGEWLMQGKIGYNRTLKNTFYLFDVTYGERDEENEGALIWLTRGNVANVPFFQKVPFIKTATVNELLADLPNLIEKQPSLLDKTFNREGVVIKSYDSKTRIKFVSEEFKETMGSKDVRLKTEDEAITAIKMLINGEQVIGDNRVQKYVHRLKEQNKIDLCPNFNDGKVLKELFANAGELAQDYIDEELNKFFEKMTKIIKKQVPTAIKNYVAKQKLIDITNELQGEQNE